MSTTSIATIDPTPAVGTLTIGPVPKSLRLPDLVAMLPSKAEFNQHYETVAKAALEWAMSYAEEVDMSKERYAHFERGFSIHLACFAYPYASSGKLRVCCDFINFLFVLDEYCDEQGREGAVRVAETVLHTLSDPTYDEGSVICRMAADLRDRLLSYMSPRAMHRLLSGFDSYIKATAMEAALREHDIVLDPATFTALRRENSAVFPCVDIISFVLDIELPDVAYSHPVFRAMHAAAADLVVLPNDLYSYNKEQATGHKNCNALTVVMQWKNLSTQEAADYVGAQFKALLDEFQANKARMPSFGPEIDAITQQYIMGMECWIVGSIHWSFAMGRYFGDDHDKMRSTLVVDLLPAYTAR